MKIRIVRTTTWEVDHDPGMLRVLRDLDEKTSMETMAGMVTGPSGADDPPMLETWSAVEVGTNGLPVRRVEVEHTRVIAAKGSDRG